MRQSRPMSIERVFNMFTDFLIALAWLVIVLLPAIVASHKGVESHNGYVDNAVNAASQDHPAPEKAASSASEA
jgi:hypothetical protein